ncbi:MAG: ATP-binding cassette domain-containing protein [Acidimicrobiales bacterium]
MDSSPSETEPLLRLSKIDKSFGPVQAIVGIDLDVPAGQVTALAGDNGAGKTVLVKTISGIWEPDGGQIFWQGKRAHIRNPKDAEKLGITTVYQDLALCDNLDIVQNMFLGSEKTRHGILDEASMELASQSTLADLSVITVRSIRQPVGSLSGGQRQAVAVGKAVMWNSKLVIFDEPTAALGVSQTAVVLDTIKQLANRGVAVMVISHSLNEIFSVADRIAVLHLGQMVATGAASEFDPQSIVNLMTTGVSSWSAHQPVQVAAAGQKEL